MMKYLKITILLFLVTSCTTQKKLAYLNNLHESGEPETFTIEIPDYRIQHRDILYITAKAMLPDGMITDLLAGSRTQSNQTYIQSEVGQYIYGYEVNEEGTILLPEAGIVKVSEMTLPEARLSIQESVDKVYNGTTVECKLLSFRYTVIGEVRSPGTYFNYSSFMNVFEAIGRAGGVSDFGRRDRLTVIRTQPGTTTTFRISLQDKSIISSEAYFLQPNDVIIVEPESKKIFNLNLPTISFIFTSVTSAITTTLLLVNYLK